MMYNPRDPWGFDGPSFFHFPFTPGQLQPPPLACTCSISQCQSCRGVFSQTWGTPLTPARQRKPRVAHRSASVHHLPSVGVAGHFASPSPRWKGSQGFLHHKSSEDLLSVHGGRETPSQAFFNLKKSGGRHGLSRSVSCLSSSRRTLLEVDHDNGIKWADSSFLRSPEHKSKKQSSACLSRSMSSLSGKDHSQRNHQTINKSLEKSPRSGSFLSWSPLSGQDHSIRTQNVKGTPQKTASTGSAQPPKGTLLVSHNSSDLSFQFRRPNLERSLSSTLHGLSSIDIQQRTLPPPPSFEDDIIEDDRQWKTVEWDFKSWKPTFEDTPKTSFNYYSDISKDGSIFINRGKTKKLRQDDHGYLEPNPPPLPPRSGVLAPFDWSILAPEPENTCPSCCCCCCLCKFFLSPLVYLHKIMSKAAAACTFQKHMGEFSLLDPSVQTTPSPSPAQTNGTIMPRKVVVALYDYNAAQVGDLCLRKNEEYEVLDDSEEHWWQMRDSQGREGYAPSNYVRDKGNLGLQQYDWYLGDASRQRAEAILMREEKEGSFVVRNSTTNSGIYTLSVFSKMSRVQVKHYHIKTDPEGMYYLSNSIKCPTIPDLIYRHQYNPGGLCTRLRNPPSQGRQAPTTAGLSHDKWEIVPSELNLLEELGSGQFGVVRHGILFGIDVAVKMMKEGTMSEDEFIEEAKVMTKLQHPNLVQLYGVCRRKRPIYIVTEYLKHGSLLNYLRNKEKVLIQKADVLLEMCMQVCEGMAYLESQKFIHRDLAARNCLVGANNLIKVGDFGLARYVVDDEYTGSGGAKFPIKWAAPEVLNYMRFSSKSDVWAFAVLMWEVFTCGKMPYGRHKNAEVAEMVQLGKVLERPRHCPPEIYEIMRKGWTHSQEQRPGFQEMRTDILLIAKTIAD